MTATAIDKARNPRDPRPNTLTTGQLPRFFELYTLIAVLLVVAGFFGLMGFNIVGWLVVSAILYLVAIGVLSSIVENRRKATDRIVRGLVVVAFLLAFIPLVSTLWEVVSRGAAAINWDFITQSAGTKFDVNTLKVTVTYGALQSIVGTLIITGIAALISIPIGILTAIYLVEYAQPTQWMARTVTFLVDVMTGIPS
ncbi:MAG TPA: phosphate ABC transporter, permease protein PstA, partial [Pseudolysinimonas sp.]|nr:phosphate ABC transporter, permease protein PstA [Pseudolysinimonas sp.]